MKLISKFRPSRDPPRFETKKYQILIARPLPRTADFSHPWLHTLGILQGSVVRSLTKLILV